MHLHIYTASSSSGCDSSAPSPMTKASQRECQKAQQRRPVCHQTFRLMTLGPLWPVVYLTVPPIPSLCGPRLNCSHPDATLLMWEVLQQLWPLILGAQLLSNVLWLPKLVHLVWLPLLPRHCSNKSSWALAMILKRVASLGMRSLASLLMTKQASPSLISRLIISLLSSWANWKSLLPSKNNLFLPQLPADPRNGCKHSLSLKQTVRLRKMKMKVSHCHHIYDLRLQ